MADPSVTRREFVRAGTVGVAGSLLGATAPVAAQSGGLSSWFENTSNYDGVVDKRGNSEVTVEVGVQANGGAFGFGPAAVRVDPGTTVTWEWTGEGGGHNVVAQDGSYESELVAEAGHTFSHTFESAGVSKYFCRPHEALGMKGAVVVGDVDVGGGTGGGAGGTGGGGSGGTGPIDYGGWFDNVSNFDGTVDKRGNSEVTVEVGVQANGGAFGFGPPAIHVDPGTKVTWEWTGEGGGHNVVAQDGSYESELVAEAGHTFSHTFESTGVSKYFCRPHEALGMKGAVVVGDVETGGGGEAAPLWTWPGGDFGMTMFGLLWATVGVGAFAVLGAEAYREARSWQRERAEAAAAEGPPVDAPPRAVERELDHESFTPYGTATLVAAYLVIVVLMWVFMYFVEFLGNGPTVIGG